MLQSGAIELHFSLAAEAQPSQCFVHVGDATSLWKQLGIAGAAGIGPIEDMDHGMREFVITDPDGNRLRVGSPIS